MVINIWYSAVSMTQDIKGAFLGNKKKREISKFLISLLIIYLFNMCEGEIGI